MQNDERDQLPPTAESLRRFLTPEHPAAETTLVAYVDGTLTPEERDGVDEHLAGCAICREDVSDLRGMQASLTPSLIRPRRVPPAAWWLLAAGLGGAAILTQIHRMQHQPAHVEVRNPEWDALVRSARATGHIDMPPSLKSLQTSPDVVRGHQADPLAGTFTPTATFVESQQPHFSWPASPDARYVVRISSANEEVAHSDVLREAIGTPPAPLPRGTTYSWQVEVHDKTGARVIPAPPHPPLLFAVLDAKNAAEIAEARRRFPDDHFLLGLLYARAGVRDTAHAELTKWLAAHPGDDAARRLRDDLER